MLLLLVLASAMLGALDDRTQRHWLVRFGADPTAPPQDFFVRRVHVGMSPAQVAGVMPAPTRIERYVLHLAGGDSVLLERYIYRLAVSDWPVDVYFNRRGEVFDLYTADNPGLGRAPRRVTPQEATEWGRAMHGDVK